MSYRIENGKVYEVKEVNVSEIEKEVKQAVEFIKQHENAKTPYLSAVAKKKAEFKTIEERYKKEIESYEAVVRDHDLKIQEAKSGLAEKKEIIENLLPAYKDFLAS